MEPVYTGVRSYWFTHVITPAVDINECLMETDSCQSDEVCINTLGSFLCTPPATPSPPTAPPTSPAPVPTGVPVDPSVVPPLEIEEPSVTPPMVNGPASPPIPVLRELSQLTHISMSCDASHLLTSCGM